MARTLILVRHGQSEWNLKNLFTGWRDPDLTAKGREEAKAAGLALKNHNFN
ncbi:MAG TPA: 2,3-bisphosphoglycerate-dependent phosphoglycerate mutase, partial [Devosia sp.]|nr:2,3-bisphosphoglycerate-dependent phosphoglycerate mutase [Devosia sp.]